MDIQGAIVTRRYAQAFINVFINELDQDGYNQFLALEKFFRARRSVLVLLGVFQGTPNEKICFLERATQSFSAPRCITALYRLLIIANHCHLLADILKRICLLYQEKKSIILFNVESSCQLSDEMLDIIKQFLACRTGLTIACSTIVNAELIAGVRLKSETFLWEYSIRKQIRCIRQAVDR